MMYEMWPPHPCEQVPFCMSILDNFLFYILRKDLFNTEKGQKCCVTKKVKIFKVMHIKKTKKKKILKENFIALEKYLSFISYLLNISFE